VLRNLHPPEFICDGWGLREFHPQVTLAVMNKAERDFAIYFVGIPECGRCQTKTNTGMPPKPEGSPFLKS
jgi:hypothetical protein